MLEAVLHTLNDIVITLSYIAHALGFIFSQILLPVKYIFVFTKTAVLTAFSSPITPEGLEGFSTTTAAFFNSLEGWSLIQLTIVSLVLVLGLFAILKLLR